MFIYIESTYLVLQHSYHDDADPRVGLKKSRALKLNGTTGFLLDTVASVREVLVDGSGSVVGMTPDVQMTCPRSVGIYS